MRESPLTDYEEALLARARALVPAPPPLPWKRAVPFFTGGIVAAGWDNADHVVLISHEGYSVTDPLTGDRLVRDRDAERTFAAMSPDNLSFTIPESNERIAIFGLWGGDGNHMTSDGWQLDVIYPWWPRVDVLIRGPRSGPARDYLDSVTLIDGLSHTTWRGCGFSPSEQHFMLLESDGPKVYTR